MERLTNGLQVFTVTEAATSTGYSKQRILNLIRKGIIVGAFKNGSGQWRLPLPVRILLPDGTEDLLSVQGRQRTKPTKPQPKPKKPAIRPRRTIRRQ